MLDALLSMPIVSTLKTIAAFIVALGILITVHEFGHFWVARRCGVKVICFSIGFGKRLWSRVDRHGTEFIIAMIPLGGYVKMLDERVTEVDPELKAQAFNNKTIAQRAAIISAGPIANFLFAIFAYWLVFIIGVPGVRPVIQQVEPNSIAERAHLVSGMQIDAINGIDTPDWMSLRLAVINQQSEVELVFTTTPFGADSPQPRQSTLNTLDWTFDAEKENPITSLGIHLVLPKLNLTLESIQEGSAAQAAGLQAGDRVISVDGNILQDGSQFAEIINRSANIELKLDVERQGTRIMVAVTPQTRQLPNGSTVGSMGVSMRYEPLPDEYRVMMQYGPLESLSRATAQTWQITTTIVKELGHLFAGDRNLSSLGGPITIAQGAGSSASSGLVGYIVFLALISVNLGIINLFPLPILDGGHLVFLAIEKVTGRPVSEKVQDYSYRFGAILLILLMGLTFFNDVTRLF